MSVRVQLDLKWIEADPEATAAAYRAEREECDCAYCRNLRAQLETLLTEEDARLLRRVGADAARPREIVAYGGVEEGRVRYEVIWWVVLAEGFTPRLALDPALRPESDNLHFAGGGPPDEAFDRTGRRWGIAWTGRAPWVLDELP